MPNGEDPWSELRKTQKLGIKPLLLCFGIFGVVVLLPEEIRRPLLPVLVPVLLLAFAVPAFRLFMTNFWPCPRCGKPFFLVWGLFRPLGSKCPHCGLGYGERP